MSAIARQLNFVVDKEYDGEKVIRFLREQAGVSSRLVCSLKRVENGITLNGSHIRTIDKLKKGDILGINIPEDTAPAESSDYEIEVLFEDEDLLVVNKPAHLPIHPSHSHQGNTLANAVAGHLQKKGRSATFRAIGRLDKGTSGLVVCALNRYAAARLAGAIEKEYLAIASGFFQGNGTINKPIYRPDPLKTLRACGEQGDEAITHWQAISGTQDMTLLRIRLETGRTHQIRVHFADMGAALVGDTMYGIVDPRIDHQALHCCMVKFIHPVTKKLISLESELPKDMQNLTKLFKPYLCK